MPVERSGPVPALEMGICLWRACGVLVACLWCVSVCVLVCVVVSVVSVSVSVSVCVSLVWCGCHRRCGVACLVLSGGLSSMRCPKHLDFQSRRGDIIWLSLRGSWLLLRQFEMLTALTFGAQRRDHLVSTADAHK